MTEHTPPIIAIKEANSHLHALHYHNQRLEKEVIELRAILSIKIEQEQKFVLKKRELKTLINDQCQVISDKTNQIVYLQSEIDNLSRQVEENCKLELINIELQRKVNILNEILKYKPALESVSLCLEQVEGEFIKDINDVVKVNSSNSNNKVSTPIDGTVNSIDVDNVSLSIDVDNVSVSNGSTDCK